MGGQRMSGHERRLGDWTIEDIFDLLKTRSGTSKPNCNASGARHNNISQQMRNVARSLTPAEIDEAAKYYASQPPNAQFPDPRLKK